MKEIAVSEILPCMHGQLVAGCADQLLSAVSTDTRSIGKDAVFFALRGENFDAHDFLNDAIQAGAVALVVEAIPSELELINGVAVIQVKDSLHALQALAAWYRRQLSIKVVGITGSNGKTSTKDFARSVLQQKFQVNATKGNFNNHIGLPLSILATEETDKVCVLEMGMNHPGEIELLCQIAKPDIGVITNVGTAHIEYMGSREAIAEEKGALARNLPDDGVLVVSAACQYAEYYRRRSHARTLVVGNGRGSVRAEELRMDNQGSRFDLVVDGLGSIPVSLPVVGRHMVTNALLAAGVGYTLGMGLSEIAEGIENSSLSSGRLRSFVHDGVSIFDDTYNANPESMKAAVETVAELNVVEGASRYVVFGKMAELGDFAKEAAREVGELVAQRGLYLVTLGDEAKGMYEAALAGGAEATHFESSDAAAEWLRSHCVSGDAVLFKGSRAAAMECVMHKAFESN